jgi:membrane-bound lytic murein transglycosylase B
MRRLFRSLGRLGAAAAITVALAGQVLTQKALGQQVLAQQVLAQQVLAQAAGGSWFPFKFPPFATGSVAPAAPLPGASAAGGPAAGGPAEWSGESGASGHPLMTADAIRAAAANFQTCLEQLWPQAERRGVSRALFDAQTAGLTPDLRIMDLLDAQPEFTKAIWDYLDLLVSDDRIQNGRAILAKHRPIFDAVEKSYGVDRHIVTAIWGVESNYGTQVGQRPVVRSTATLACVGRRQDYFREEFLSALEIIAHGDVDAARLQGSWAGAFGPTQFMPTSFKKYAVDFDGDGRRDVVDSIPDLIASTANNLKKDGWVTGQTWGFEVVVPERFNFMLADRARVMTMQEWSRAGISRPGGKAFARLDDRAFLLVPAGAQGPGFLMLQNFRVIMKYNPSEAYALAIGYLADRLRGGEPFVQQWPRYERVLTRDERLELQQLLANHGYDVGTPDGQLGGRTRAALRQFQATNGFVPDGFASATLLERLRRP